MSTTAPSARPGAERWEILDDKYIRDYRGARTATVALQGPTREEIQIRHAIRLMVAAFAQGFAVAVERSGDDFLLTPYSRRSR